ncbi:MAG: hypothetical protein MUC36_02090 [Planctomycetes bacterium]|jgi:hypothetical protein|nr:hypothetical protein [Planctomycetota bacterium]
MANLASIAGFVFFAVLSAGTAVAQCANVWQSELALAGTNGVTHAVVRWDPDGSGPSSEVWVFGGEFTRAGNLQVQNLATFDPATQQWAALGGGVSGAVFALTTLANGDLVVGGNFFAAGGVPANRIARWNGTAWSVFGAGCPGPVSAITVRPNGEILAGGSVGTPPTAMLLSWNGSSWTANSSLTGLGVAALTTLANGDVVAGGFLQTAGGVAVPNLARWNGTSWSTLGTVGAPPTFSSVRALATMSNGDLVVGGGVLYLTGSSTSIARWNGATWEAMGSGYGPPNLSLVKAFAPLPNGGLIAVGSPPSGSGTPVARWNGSAWATIGTQFALQGEVNGVLALPSGDVVVAGLLPPPIGGGLSHVARWNGSSWTGLAGAAGVSPTSAVTAMVSLPGGDVVVASGAKVMRRSGGRWTTIGESTPVPSFGADVFALAVLADGSVIAAGRFASIGGTAANSIARWDGSAWFPLGGGITGPSASVSALAVLPNGDVVAGGAFAFAGGLFSQSIARWDGSSWSALGSGLTGSFPVAVAALLVLPNGDLVVGGSFGQDGSMGAVRRIGRWDGVAWQPFGTGMNDRVTAFARLPNGDLAAGGTFTLAGGVSASRLARWDGSAWSALGDVNGLSVNALWPLPGGDLVVGGQFLGIAGQPVSNIARLRGSTWSNLGGGCNNSVFALQHTRSGELLVGGQFGTAGPLQSPNLARLTTTCPATATVTGAGCAGSGGTNVLTATSLPWLGTTFTSVASGLSSVSLAVHVLGSTSVAVPLAAVLPQGLPGCLLTAAPDVLELHLPVAGTVALSVPIHSSVNFVGFVFHQQVVALELSPAADITALSSTNALQVVKGQF